MSTLSPDNVSIVYETETTISPPGDSGLSEEVTGWIFQVEANFKIFQLLIVWNPRHATARRQRCPGYIAKTCSCVQNLPPETLDPACFQSKWQPQNTQKETPKNIFVSASWNDCKKGKTAQTRNRLVKTDSNFAGTTGFLQCKILFHFRFGRYIFVALAGMCGSMITFTVKFRLSEMGPFIINLYAGLMGVLVGTPISLATEDIRFPTDSLEIIYITIQVRKIRTVLKPCCMAEQTGDTISGKLYIPFLGRARRSRDGLVELCTYRHHDGSPPRGTPS